MIVAIIEIYVKYSAEKTCWLGNFREWSMEGKEMETKLEFEEKQQLELKNWLFKNGNIMDLQYCVSFKCIYNLKSLFSNVKKILNHFAEHLKLS